MAAKRGRLFLVKIGDGANPENFTTVAGQRSTSLTVNNESVDISNKDSGAWRKLGDDMGLRSMQISLEGVFQDSAAEDVMRAAASGGGLNNYQIVADNGDQWEGSYLLTSFQQSGTYNGAQQYSYTLESADTVTFTAA